MDDEVTQDEYDDAVIEDTCHCDCCGASFVLGGNDHVIVEVPQRPLSVWPTVAQLSLCMDCAEAVYKAYQETLREADVCEHGISTGDWCEPCHKEYREARERFEKEGES